MHNQIYWYIEVQSDYIIVINSNWEKYMMSNDLYNMSVESICIIAAASICSIPGPNSSEYLLNKENGYSLIILE